MTPSSTTKPHRLEENVGALNVKISKEEDAEIRSILSTITGGRYSSSGSSADQLYADSPPLKP